MDVINPPSDELKFVVPPAFLFHCQQHILQDPRLFIGGFIVARAGERESAARLHWEDSEHVLLSFPRLVFSDGYVFFDAVSLDQFTNGDRAASEWNGNPHA